MAITVLNLLDLNPLCRYNPFTQGCDQQYRGKMMQILPVLAGPIYNQNFVKKYGMFFT